MAGEQPLEAVVFDLGETLVCEQRHWASWADWLEVPRLTFFAALGTVIERRQHHRAVFELVRPGIDLEAEEQARARAGLAWAIEPGDLYPDAVSCLAGVRRAGLAVGIAANQPAGIEATLGQLGEGADLLATSGSWGIEKPSPAFFARIAEELALAPGAIAYVGDRVDNDVVPAHAAGMRAVFVRRGPWGTAHAARPELAVAAARLEGLDELPGALGLT